jgi:VanZ family protein
MCGILFTSSLGHAATPVGGLLQTIVSKSGHVLEYALLGTLLLLAIRSETDTPRFTWTSLVVIAIIGVGFASLDELRQSFVPGREPRVADVLLDLTSLVVTATLVGRVLDRLRVAPSVEVD